MKKVLIASIGCMLVLVLCVTGASQVHALTLADLIQANIEEWEAVGGLETGYTMISAGDDFVNTTYGLLDAQGNTILEPVYDSIEYAAGKLIVGRDDQMAILDLKGNILYGYANVNILFYGREKALFVIGDGSGNSERVSSSVGNSLKLYDLNLNQVLPFSFQEISMDIDSNDYFIHVEKSDGTSRNGFYRYGKGMVIPAVYCEFKQLEQGLIAAKNENNQWCVLTEDGKLFMPFSDREITSHYGGYFTFAEEVNGTRKYGMMDSNSNIIIPAEYDSAYMQTGNVLTVGTRTDEKEIDYYINGMPVYDYVYLYEETTLPSQPFLDVARSTYFWVEVEWAVDRGITTGTTKLLFSPNENCTNAQILTFLWRAAGSPEPSIANPFTSICDTDYYYNAVVWAYEEGILTDLTFQPTMPCTRGMTALYLWRWFGSPAVTEEPMFNDVPENAPYYDAANWVREAAISNGTGNGRFDPDAICNRAQIVTFLYRAIAIPEMLEESGIDLEDKYD